MQNKHTPKLATNGESAVAESPADLISAEQYRQVAKLATELEVNADQASRSLYDVPVEELSKGGATDLIAYLKHLKGK
jgi:hypothetical protein